MASGEDQAVAEELAALLRQVEQDAVAATEEEEDGTHQPHDGHQQPLRDLQKQIGSDPDVQTFTQDIDGVLQGVVRIAGQYLYGMKDKIRKELELSGEELRRQQVEQIVRLHKTVHSSRLDLENSESQVLRLKQHTADVKAKAVDHAVKRSDRALARLVLFTWRAYTRCQSERRRFIQGVSQRVTKRQAMTTCFEAWSRATLQSKLEKEEERHKRAIEGISKEIVRKYENELMRLRSELQLKQEELEREVAQRHRTKEELHRTFLKGWTTMNLEALALLGRQPSSPFDGQPDNVAVTESPNMSSVTGFDHQHHPGNIAPYDEQPRPPLALEPANHQALRGGREFMQPMSPPL